jgi:hypothetical protein
MSAARSGSGAQEDLFEVQATRGLLDKLLAQSRAAGQIETLLGIGARNTLERPRKIQR